MKYSLLAVSLLLTGCSGEQHEVFHGPAEESLAQFQECPAATAIQIDEIEILGMWTNENRYLIEPGDPVERILTFNSENTFKSLNTIYNGCPYEENPDPNSGCDDWYSQVVEDMGYFAIEENIITLYFSGQEEKLLVERASESQITLSVGVSCSVKFNRM